MPSATEIAGQLAAQFNNLPSTQERVDFIKTLGLTAPQQALLAGNALNPAGTSAEEMARTIGGFDSISNALEEFRFVHPGLGAPAVAGGGGFEFPSGTSATSLGMGNAFSFGAGGDAGDVAFGFPLFERVFSMLLSANAERRATVDQNVSILRTLGELERVSPTRAASLAAGLGLPEPQFDFLELLNQPGPLFQPGGGALGGRVGGQSLSLPSVLSGQQLSGVLQNDNLARIVSDVADYLGAPDYLQRSAAATAPASRALAAMGL